MTQSEIDRIDIARHLLPAPGDEVVGQLIAEIRRLKEREALWNECADKTMQIYGGCYRPEHIVGSYDEALNIVININDTLKGSVGE